MVDIQVCVKQSVDLNTLSFNPSTLEPDYSRAQFKIGDFEMNALEEAIRIKEKLGGRVVLLSAGHDVKPSIIREGLAMGADEAYVVSDKVLENADPWTYAKVLATLSKRVGSFDLMICGEASVDKSEYQVGPRIAEELNMPSITHAIKLEFDGKRVVAERALEGYVEVVEAESPAVVTVGLEINTPRLPSLLMIRAATKKPINNVTLNDLGLSEEVVKPKIKELSVKVNKTERRRMTLSGTPEEMAEKLVSILVGEGLLKA